jgi:hypothetical protein
MSEADILTKIGVRHRSTSRAHSLDFVPVALQEGAASVETRTRAATTWIPVFMGVGGGPAVPGVRHRFSSRANGVELVPIAPGGRVLPVEGARR